MTQFLGWWLVAGGALYQSGTGTLSDAEWNGSAAVMGTGFIMIGISADKGLRWPWFLFAGLLAVWGYIL